MGVMLIIYNLAINCRNSKWEASNPRLKMVIPASKSNYSKIHSRNLSNRVKSIKIAKNSKILSIWTTPTPPSISNRTVMGRISSKGRNPARMININHIHTSNIHILLLEWLLVNLGNKRLLELGVLLVLILFLPVPIMFGPFGKRKWGKIFRLRRCLELKVMAIVLLLRMCSSARS